MPYNETPYKGEAMKLFMQSVVYVSMFFFWIYIMMTYMTAIFGPR
jgi:hypothetical protein